MSSVGQTVSCKACDGVHILRDGPTDIPVIGCAAAKHEPHMLWLIDTRLWLTSNRDGIVRVIPDYDGYLWVRGETEEEKAINGH